ncbi:uncharacterized membrane protein YcaP (DUF421 family) [Cerasibacillus quisquiliarum]|uniref:UPF0702 transmembrane protein YetF n=1 Tax=Cerasibacillus quisquiliarum TaxID=227865 RepID=A0A511UVM9_9BACI|nr:DUF421 domain-containing protein [Cerasibacillus quisquiliarum]MBB5146322.1 uncharacterized membrane protein YcaP (DUF421 family) [Cerasibacillus quisquiliarum]GEN30647.1 UPF0702 transmembrane protein YetF [Cerasibacillus quisquiliarum]
MKYMFMFIDTIFSFCALFILTKLLGKTQMSQLTPFDFIAAVVLGELVGNALFDKNAGITEIGFLIILWGLLLYSAEMITQKYRKSRFLLEGKPSLVIHKGQIMFEEMKKNKIDIDELKQLLRSKDVFSIREVEYAIMESNGDLSVLKKAVFQNPIKKDFNLYGESTYLPFTIISDGELIEDNLKEANLTKEWLIQELTKQKISHIKDVLYAEYTEGEPLFIQTYTERNNEEST